jgi:hypothetical protein
MWRATARRPRWLLCLCGWFFFVSCTVRAGGRLPGAFIGALAWLKARLLSYPPRLAVLG